MRGNYWLTAVVTAIVLAGCARPGGTPQEAPEEVTVVVSATVVASGVVPAMPLPVTPLPASAIPAPARSGEASCARGATPIPSLDPSASFDVNDPQQRARRVLAEQYRPIPRRGAVPQAAVPGAEACVRLLKVHFSLLASGSGTIPEEAAIGAALRSAGLTKIIVHAGPAFAASTGAACVHGTFTTSGPAFTIGPPVADGSCRP